jgi:hypothetical protein
VEPRTGRKLQVRSAASLSVGLLLTGPTRGLEIPADPYDLRAFDHIASQTFDGDRRSLLALRELAAADGDFAYLEIGSHLGGSLQPFVVDPRCTAIVSIDSRPPSQPDKRLPDGEHFHYDGNSTRRMLSLLAEIPGADLRKITTIEAATDAIDPASVGVEPTLCFIDGEHTDLAVIRDAVFCATVAPRSMIAFHDRGVVGRAINAFVRVSGGYACPLPDDMFVVDLGGRGRMDFLMARPWRWRAANALGVAGAGAELMPRVRAAARRRRPDRRSP